METIIIGGCIAGAAIIYMIYLLAVSIDKAAKRTDKIFALMEIFADRILRLETKPSFIPKKSTYKKIHESFHETTTPLTIKEIYAKEKVINKVVNTKLPKKKQTKKESIKEAEDTAKVIRTVIRETTLIFPELPEHHNNGFTN